MSLQSQIEHIIAQSGAEMGVAIHHIESGEEIQINAERLFPMASVLKIPVLAEAMAQLADNRFRLTDRWTLTDAEKNLGSGVLPFFEAGLSPTVLDLLTLMIIISDNTATDLVINRLGGPGAVEARMQQLGLHNIFFKMTIRQLFEDCLPSTDGTLDRTEFARHFHKVGYRKEGVTFKASPENNASSAQDMTRLCAMAFRGEIVDRTHSDQMLAILLKQQLNDRLPRFLPPGTKFAHKTGTIGGVRNDAGVIYIHEESHAAVTVFSEWDLDAVWNDGVAQRQRIYEIESAFGHIGRAVFEAFDK